MKKSELIQIIKDQSGIEFYDRTVAIHIGNVFNHISGQLFSQNPTQWMFYTKKYTLDVTNRVAPLTFSIIQNITNGSGVPKITPVGDETFDMYPMPLYALNSSVDANNMSPFVFYTVTNNEICFNKSLPTTVTEVIAHCVVEFKEYADDDLISLPSGASQLIIDGAVAAVKGDPSVTNIYKKK